MLDAVTRALSEAQSAASALDNLVFLSVESSSYVLMAPIGEAYFPPLDRCFGGEHQLLYAARGSLKTSC